jgi:hypothetical protein
MLIMAIARRHVQFVIGRCPSLARSRQDRKHHYNDDGYLRAFQMSEGEFDVLITWVINHCVDWDLYRKNGSGWDDTYSQGTFRNKEITIAWKEDVASCALFAMNYITIPLWSVRMHHCYLEDPEGTFERSVSSWHNADCSRSTTTFTLIYCSVLLSIMRN